MRSLDNLLFWRYSFVSMALMCVKVYCCLVLALSILVFFLAPQLVELMPFIAVAAAILLLIFIGLFCTGYFSKRDAELRYSLAREMPLLLEISEEDCKKRSPCGLAICPWSSFVESLETKDFYVLRRLRDQVLIPRRVLNNRITAAFVENIMRRKILKHVDLT